jgi:hypothetical protein
MKHHFHYKLMEYFESFQYSKPLACQFQHPIEYSLTNYHYLDFITINQLVPTQKQNYSKDDFDIDLRAPD